MYTVNVAPQTSWLKHPLDGDGLNTHLYHHLWKKNKSFQSCPYARVPDTIVYEHNFPRGWYLYDAKNHEIAKQAGRSLDSASIFAHFSKPNPGGVEIVAQYMFSVHDPFVDKSVTTVEFFTKEELFQFLHVRRNRPDGILQKFVLPKNKHNHQIQAVWSPRVTMVQRRVNCHSLTDRFIPNYERCVTFDGGAHFSELGHCAWKMKEQVKRICTSFVEHFHETDRQTICRLVMYFKVDTQGVLWVLWANSIRMSNSANTYTLSPRFKAHQQAQQPGNKNKPKPKKKIANPAAEPLNLSPLFKDSNHGPQAEEKRKEELQLQLQELDAHTLEIGGDYVFAGTMQRSFPSIQPTLTSPVSMTTSNIAAHNMLAYFRNRKNAGSAGSKRTALYEPSTAEVVIPDDFWGLAKLGTAERSSLCTLLQDNSSALHDLQQLGEEKEVVASQFDDLNYEIYSHFMGVKRGGKSTPCLIQPSGKHMDKVLLDRRMQEALCKMGFEEYDELEDGVMSWECPELLVPVTHVKKCTMDVVNQIFEERMRAIVDKLGTSSEASLLNSSWSAQVGQLSETL
eukprot:TRINITY_DN76507_c0_g1_i1.p1 TRINITY_DN76507_c0_g1~~TRINITY_DN76507_c0_g1_i1.p1  ORF type:complete len:566 (+),score=36.11 TRINITY_DN76507_c0_g1_i1:57-1754(+)